MGELEGAAFSVMAGFNGGTDAAWAAVFAAALGEEGHGGVEKLVVVGEKFFADADAPGADLV